jgi:phenylalanyl-tRNA synthetase beta subunit
LLGYRNEHLKNVFVFDFFENKKNHEIKIGFRLVFQSLDKTLNEQEIQSVLNDIIRISENIESVSIPGMHK